MEPGGSMPHSQGLSNNNLYTSYLKIYILSLGVKQGCLLSPTIFLIFMTDMRNSAKRDMHAGFADDVYLFEHNV